MLETLIQEVPTFGPGDEALFTECLRRLLGSGFLWRDDDDDRKAYGFATRRLAVLHDFLRVCGFNVIHHERLHIIHVISEAGVHRLKLGKETTIWLLILRLIYAEQRESASLQLTRYPVATVADVYRRYGEFFPGRVVRKKTSLEEALKTLQSLKLIRAPEGGTFRVSDPEQLVEILPVVQVILPSGQIAALETRLRSLGRGVATADAASDDLPVSEGV